MSLRAQLENRAFSWVVSCWVGLWLGWVVPVRLVVGAKGEVSTAAAHASGRPLPVFLASPPSKACAMRSPTSSEHACPTSGLLVRTPSCGRSCGSRREQTERFLLFAARRVGECVSLMCHCVRHIDVDNKHGRSVKAIHSFLSRWKACTELCAGTQKSRAARRARWGARTVRGAHPGFGSPP